MRVDSSSLIKQAAAYMDAAKTTPEKRAVIAEIRKAFSAFLRGWNTSLRAPQHFDAMATAALVLKNAPPFECLGDALRKFVPALANADKLGKFLLAEGPGRICKTLKARAGADKTKRLAFLCRPGVVKAILSQEIRKATGTRFYVRPDGSCKLLILAEAKQKLAKVGAAKKAKPAAKAKAPKTEKTDAPRVDPQALAQ